ncbi:MAG: hypothetical protein WD065_00360 [Planctomycetaceae bacterium]|jgi:hypothetical protein
MAGLESLFGQMTDVWVVVAYVISMFTIAAFRPQQIDRPDSWRNSYSCFAAYLIIPAIINAVMDMLNTDAPRNPFGPAGAAADSPMDYVRMLVPVLSKSLLASAIVFGLIALKIGPSSTENE